MAAIPKIRSALYRAARILGDMSAIGKGKIGRRIMRRGAGRATARMLSRLFK